MLIVTNNPKFKDYTDRYEVEFVDTDYIGVLKKGNKADFIVFETNDFREILYRQMNPLPPNPLKGEFGRVWHGFGWLIWIFWTQISQIDTNLN